MNVIAWILAIIGAINWGLVGFAKFDLVAWICGGQTAWVSRVIYALVGLAGLWCIVTLLTRDRKTENTLKNSGQMQFCPLFLSFSDNAPLSKIAADNALIG